ncbi:MAG: hypothetical protein IJA12_08410 [Oscillospiraceae bacterium]|nr:hypothetical protein [Oscillospiraceae bacterium]
MKTKKIIAVLLLSVTLSGCSGSSDVRNKAFIKEIGVDYGETQEISLRTFGSDEVIKGNGKTLLSAVGDCENTQSKNLFSGHLEVFASSPANIGNNLLTLLSNNRISPSCYVLCVPENAVSFIDKEGGKLAELIRSSGRNGIILPRTISGVLNDLLESDRKASVPVQKDGRLTMAVISPNELIGTLSEDESKGLCWLHGNVKDVYLPIEYDGNTTDFYIRKSNTKITAERSGDKINITVEIKINGNSDDSNKNSAKAVEEVSKTISALCSKTIAKTVTVMKADLFGIERTIKSARLTNETEWEKIIPLLNFSYNIKIAQ